MIAVGHSYAFTAAMLGSVLVFGLIIALSRAHREHPCTLPSEITPLDYGCGYLKLLGKKE